MSSVILPNMDAERSNSFMEFVVSPQMSAIKMLEDLQHTPHIQDYSPDKWETMADQVDGANKAMAFVATGIINHSFNELIKKHPDRSDAIFGATQMCLIPFLAEALGVKFNIDPESLMIAAAHYGVSEISNLYQRAEGKDRAKLAVYALFFADAQARILGFRTSTTILALDLDDENNLRLQNIAIVSQFENEEEIEKAGLKALFEGHKVTKGKNKGMYFVE